MTNRYDMLDVGSWKAQGRRQRTEGRGQTTEAGGRRSEGRSKTTDLRIVDFGLQIDNF